MSITLKSRRGAIGKSWHAAALREAMEIILGVGRAGGGKADARAGRVQWLDVSPGTARGDVLGADGELYQARIELPVLPAGDREALLVVAHASPELPARLASGEYPQSVEGELARSEVSLLPRGASELSHDCSCLDWPGPCRHVAALSYVLVEAVDEHPVHLLTLRGLRLDDLVAPPEGPAAGADTASDDAADEGDADEDTAGEGAAGESGGRAAPSAFFDPQRADPAHLAEVLGEQAAAIIASFYRAGVVDLPDPAPGEQRHHLQ